MRVDQGTARLLSRIEDLPEELVHILRNGTNDEYLDAVTAVAGNARYTDRVVVTLDCLLVEIVTRWTTRQGVNDSIPLFGRILQNAPYLAKTIQDHLSRLPTDGCISVDPQDHDDKSLIEVLLGLHRLLVFDAQSFQAFVRVVDLQDLFAHQSRAVRYLAIRCVGLCLRAADAAVQKMVQAHLGSESVLELWEAKNIDYRFFSLWEERRYKDLASALREPPVVSVDVSVPTRYLNHNDWSDGTVEIGDVLLPRRSGRVPKAQGARLVSVPTTARNLQSFAQSLLLPHPVLIQGRPGAGKTLLVRHVAESLDKLDKLVTLHLNEQSDTKLLVGMYTTGATPGTFSWQPGVLTTAVLEGHWVFIEDIDRAPNEIISTLLPLIEKRELTIPNRGQVLRAAPGFRIVASTSTAEEMHGKAVNRTASMLGARLWTRVSVQSLSPTELRSIVEETFPSLQEHVPRVLAVYNKMSERESSANFPRGRTISARPLTPRELLKWCQRLSAMLATSVQFDETLQNNMFLDAMDCFGAATPDVDAREEIASTIAEALQVPPNISKHLLWNRSLHDEYQRRNASLRIGRVSLGRQSSQRSHQRQSQSRPFSHNDHSLRLLEQIAAAVRSNEPLLLVGETGTGKTTVIQHLADQLDRKLVPFNLSQQSESGDLLGGFKPVNIRSIMIPLKDEFDELFAATFGQKKNESFIRMLGKYFAKGKWKQTCKLWRGALDLYDEMPRPQASPRSEGHQNKRQKTSLSGSETSQEALRPRWERFALEVQQLEAQLDSRSNALTFSFVEGSIVKAVRNGDWVLLDEINLASSDTLEALADLFAAGRDADRSILLTETGDIERVRAHPNFRVFAAMNPATDVGKKDLPVAIRSRFTEIYVASPDSDAKSLKSIVGSYLSRASDPQGERLASDVTRLYQDVQKLSESNALVDGAGQRPHYSLRTLTRSLLYALDMAPLCTLRRALLEGFHMSFSTLLDAHSDSILSPLIWNCLYSRHANARAELTRPLKMPVDGHQYVQVGEHWLARGNSPIVPQPQYIITPSVERNLKNLIRAASTRRFPILIQGPTSAGKTSMIEYVANVSGNRFVRINNHEHTDLQEYLGTYVSDTSGKLHFQEGILVEALRFGYWVVLDELNLAPSDILEALNRLLDDNRELLIPETQEIIRPHENFMLFATQNPAGLYGGRKVLSRAFRNRFLELHFDDIPVAELQEILERRTLRPKSWCKHIVAVYRELSSLRQETRLFEQRSFATLRDLFRWAHRDADSKQQLAINGFMLLGERVRKPEERKAVAEVIEKTMSLEKPYVHIDLDKLYTVDQLHSIPHYNTGGDDDVVWTSAMRRLFILVDQAIRTNEPVLLVGETGCGKTTVCQMLATGLSKPLHTLNAHQNTETGDLIGAQRPVRNRGAIERQLRVAVSGALKLPSVGSDAVAEPTAQLLQQYDDLVSTTPDSASAPDKERIRSLRRRWLALFEWTDGALVEAMKSGEHFLLDEISLADDSVLERLNSVLESQRSLLLAEKGTVDSFVVAADGFQFLATMNPGGDFGKRELSPALRNRFTEIWVPPLSNLGDVVQITKAKLQPRVADYAQSMVAFAHWFNNRFNSSASSSVSIRDMLAWINFANRFAEHDPITALVHGAAMVFIDTLGANPAAILTTSLADIDLERRACLKQLGTLLGRDAISLYTIVPQVTLDDNELCVGPFRIEVAGRSTARDSFALEAPTTIQNAMRVLRGLQVSKPILLEGNPGVGKTTLVMALASACGRRLERMNLSEQTDIMDLFGADAPVDGGMAGTFAWRDGPFLTAMKRGDWVLLDEMNLASQSILEGLNACLDHRGEIYVAELDQTFKKHPDFRLFAAQNPHHQGGGRKGLPASFVNRFTVVYADLFKPEDLLMICKKTFPQADEGQIQSIITFITEMEHHAASHEQGFGAQGSPWELNLRDILRWLKLSQSSDGFLPSATANDLTDIVVRSRFRNVFDKSKVDRSFEKYFQKGQQGRNFYHNLDAANLHIGIGSVERSRSLNRTGEIYLDVNVNHLPILEALMVCITKSWPVILVGSTGSGKTTLLEQLASLTGAKLTVLPLHTDVDATDLIGGFEQVDVGLTFRKLLQDVRDIINRQVVTALSELQPAVPLRRLFEALDKLDRLASVPVTDRCIQDLKDLLGVVQDSCGISTDALTRSCDMLLRDDNQATGPRFQWIDGLLIEAMQEGTWLVLDNANLCSSAVLDRLNALLEPNGYLTVSEHSDLNGQAPVVRPHADFRIFMTMDPRHGELSRAMRNRAIELHIEPPQQNVTSRAPVAFLTDSFVSRFRNFSLLESADSGGFDQLLADVAVQQLSFSDMQFAQMFQDQLSTGLYECTATCATSFDRLSKFPLDFANKIRTMYKHALDGLNGDGLDNTLAQPVHPLSNQPLLLRQPKVLHVAQQLGFLFDVGQICSRMVSGLDAIRARTAKGIFMTALERKVKSTQTAMKSVDMVAFAARILFGIVEHLQSIAEDRLSTMGDLSGTAASTMSIPYQWLHEVQAYWWALYGFCDCTEPDEAVLNSMRALGLPLLLTEGSENIPLPTSSRLATSLQAARGSQASETGKSQSLMWDILAPPLPSSEERVYQLLNLEASTREFIKKAVVSRMHVAAIAEQYTQLIEAGERVVRGSTDPSYVIDTLLATFQELSSLNAPETWMPHFKSTFLTLISKLRSENRLDRGPAHNSHLVTTMRLLVAVPGSASASSRFPTSVQDVVQACKIGEPPGDILGPLIKGNMHQMLFKAISSASSTPLRNLPLLHTEIQTLGQALSLSSAAICYPETELLDNALRSSLSLLVSIHWRTIPDSSILHQYVDSAGSYDTSKSQHLAMNEEIYEQLNSGLKPVVEYLGSRSGHRSRDLASSASAWLSLAMTALRLYIPGQATDPALQPQLAQQLFRRKRRDLLDSLKALETFESMRSGTTTNLRIQNLLGLLNDMGAEPPVAAIARPKISRINALTEDFRAILRLLDSTSSMDLLTVDHSALKLARQNVVHLMERLSISYRCYDDMVVPAVSFLTALEIGLGLFEQARSAEATRLDPMSSVYKSLIDAMPALRSSSHLLPQQSASESIADLSGMSPKRLHLQMQYLDLLTVHRLTHASRDPDSLLVAIDHGLSSLHSYWKVHLEKAQREEAAKSSLYAFRGDQQKGDELEDAEFDELFGISTPDRPGQSTAAVTDSPRTLAIRLCDAHQRFFGKTESMGQAYAESFEGVSAALMGADSLPDVASFLSAQDVYPVLILRTYQQRRMLDGDPNRELNFYKDANVQEARRIQALVTNVERRFVQLRERWPEHATPVEVLRCTDDLLTVPIDAPVATYLSKVEKLQSTFYEWQRIASREFTAAPLFDELTRVIIGWRQLELRTWANLLDDEVNKSREEARSWWFVAYENLIAAPRSSIEHGSEHQPSDHITNLLRTLKDFVASAPIGQYEERVNLLQCFSEHLAQKTRIDGRYSALLYAVRNLLRYQEPFLIPVKETIAKARQALAKELSDVIRLASWKDTTIDALRQSAKASHRKLFRLVRKFRDVLHRSSESLMQEWPQAALRQVSSRPSQPFVLAKAIVSGMIWVYAERAPGWNERPARFRNIDITVQLMCTLALQRRGSAPDYTTSQVHEFITGVLQSVRQLEKATPQHSTKENTEEIKHLRVQKRRLFADVLKTMREMGLRSNVSASTLRTQSSLFAVLARLKGFLPAPGGQQASTTSEQELYRLLHSMEDVRNVAREHSTDLTPAEVSRSLSYLESILELVVVQHNSLSTSTEVAKQVSLQISTLSNLAATSSGELSISDGDQEGYEMQVITRCATVSQLLMFLVPIAKSQCELGSLSYEDALNELKPWPQKLRQHVENLKKNNDLPPGLSSTKRKNSVAAAVADLAELRLLLITVLDRCPELIPVLERIKPWLQVTETNKQNDGRSGKFGSIQDFQRQLLATTDAALGAMQDTKEHQPTNGTDSAGNEWLISSSGRAIDRIQACRVPHLKSALEDLSQSFQSLSASDLRIAAAMLATVVPILEQYWKCLDMFLHDLAELYGSCCSLANYMAGLFLVIGRKGFCTPPEKSKGEERQGEELESGTGLGEGEGAEDISKDIKDDEDLTDLAQEAGSDKEQEQMEDEKDAVDMADEDMAGQLGDAPDNDDQEDAGSRSGSEQEEMEEETGDVDDLGPSTVDEKLWDDGKPAENEKEKEDEKGKGSKDEDDAVAQHEEAEIAEGDDAPEPAAEEREEVTETQPEQLDSMAKEDETLDLPEDLQIDAKEENMSDIDKEDQLSDAGSHGASELGDDEEAVQDADQDEDAAEQGTQQDTEMDDVSQGTEQLNGIEEEGDEKDDATTAEDEQQLTQPPTDSHTDADAVQSEERGAGGEVQTDIESNERQHQAPAAASNAASGAQKEPDEAQEVAPGEQGRATDTSREAAGRHDEDTPEQRALRKLGDSLQQWFKQNRSIQEASKEDAEDSAKPDVDMANVDFEHLPEDHAAAETQALGAATEDQTRAIDESNAVDVNESEQPTFPDDDEPEAEFDEPEHDKMSVDGDANEAAPGDHGNDEEVQQRTFVGPPTGQPSRENYENVDAEDESTVQEVDTQLAEVHLEAEAEVLPRPADEARSMWMRHEASTRTLSLALTEQLRLILEPTLATKMRGDFRTGKRLNIKRIIPYIASQYKRDKIWMRRSVPSKRNYQVMLALDDSRSMAEGETVKLAFDTLALVARALTMLEAGEVSVVSFGEDLAVAHDFDKPFSSEAGVDVLRRFGFDQRKTDVKRLIAGSLDLFREARMRATGNGADLWQLQLIVSDGICEDHSTIQRLVRQAQEERIMIVFVILDAAAKKANAEGEQSKSRSITDLQTAEIVTGANGEPKVVRHKYLDTFPFRWWIVVRDIRELPGVLSTALRQWFAEVVEAA